MSAAPALDPHGELNPLAIDPADYPHKALICGADPLAGTFIFWADRDVLPLADDVVDALVGILRNGGHALILARDAEVLGRAEAAVVMLAGAVLMPQTGAAS